jgi:hypothetical protein
VLQGSQSPIRLRRRPFGYALRLQIGRLVIDGGGDVRRRVDAVLGLVRGSTREPTIAFIGAACPRSGDGAPG